MKSNLMKSGILLAVILVLLMAVTMTAYAVASDNDYDYLGEGFSIGQLFPDEALIYEVDGAAIVVMAEEDSDNLAELINEITGGNHDIALPQGNSNIIIIMPTHALDGIADMMAMAYAMDNPLMTMMPEPPTQSASSERQPVVPTSPQTASPTPPTTAQAQNRVEIITRAEQSGNPLQDTSFTVYRADGNQRVGEVTTDANGKASLSLSRGEYYMRNDSVQYGYLRERSRIFFAVGAYGDVTVEVTIERDTSIPYADVGNITVPKTGEMPPVMNYIMGMVMLAFAVFCGIALLRERKRCSYKRKGALAYA